MFEHRPLATYGDVFERYNRCLYCSLHTTAGYLPQSFAARLGSGPQAYVPYIDLFTTVFPEGAGYHHDDLDRRTELTAEQRPVEPTNADSHLAFIGSGLRACVSYVTRRPGPVSFIDLDGVNAGKPRRRMTTLVGYDTEIEVAKTTLHVPVSSTHPVDAVNLKDARLGLYDQLDELIRKHGVEKGRVRLSLGPGEQFASLTVNEYETLLMRNDLAEVLRNPLRFAAQKAKHAWDDPRAVPSKAIDYAKYDLVRAVNRLRRRARPCRIGVRARLFAGARGPGVAISSHEALGRFARVRHEDVRARRGRRRYLPGADHGAVAQGRPRRAPGRRHALPVRLTYTPRRRGSEVRCFRCDSCYCLGKFPINFEFWRDFAMKKLATSDLSRRVGRPRCSTAAAGARCSARAAAPNRIRRDCRRKRPSRDGSAKRWNPHEGGLLRVKVHLRFGVEAPVGLRGDDAKGVEADAGRLVLRTRVDGGERSSEQRVCPAPQRRDRSARGVRCRRQLPALVGQGSHRRPARRARRSREQRLGRRSRRRDSRSSRPPASCS